MADIGGICYEHEAPFWVVLVGFVVKGISSGDTRQKQPVTCKIYRNPPLWGVCFFRVMTDGLFRPLRSVILLGSP